MMQDELQNVDTSGGEQANVGVGAPAAAVDDSNENNLVMVDDDDDTTPAFIDPKEAIEVKVDDNDVPMDDDDDNEDGEDDDAMMEEEQGETSSTKVAVADMSKAKISSHTGPVYAVAICSSSTGTPSSSLSSLPLVIVSGGGDDKAFLHTLKLQQQPCNDDNNQAPAPAVQQPAVESRLLEHAHTDSASSVAMNFAFVTADLVKTPRLVAVGSYDGTIAIYNNNNNSNNSVSMQTILQGPTDVECLAFHPKGGTVLLAGSAADGSLWMFHLLMQKCLQVFVGHSSCVVACDFTPDGKFALSASSDGTVRVWAPRTGVCKHVFQCSSNYNANAGNVAGLTCMAINGGSDGQLILVGAEDGQAHACHVGSKKIVASLRHFQVPAQPPSRQQGGDNNDEEDDNELLELPMSVEAVGFCPSHPTWCATGGMDGVLKIWDLAMDGGQCRHACRTTVTTTTTTTTTTTGDEQDPQSAGAGAGGITRLTWHPRLPLVFTSTTNGSLFLWDARNGKLLHTLTGGHTDVVNDMAVNFYITTNGEEKAVIVTGSDDHQIRVFELDVSALLLS